MMEKELPEGWLKTTFDQVAEATDFVANGSFEALRLNVTQSSSPDYAILLRLKDHSNAWNGPFSYVTKDSYEFLQKSSLKAGDLFIANVGAPGRLFLVPELGMPMTIGPNGLRVRSYSVTSNKFLSYYYKSFFGKEEIDNIVTGTAQLKFNKTGLRATNVLLPPLAEQKRIVAKLDMSFGYLETLKASLARIPELLKTFRQSVLTQAVTGKLTGNFETTLLGDMGVNIQTGPFGSSLHKEDYIENGTPVINPSHIKNGEILPDRSISISDSKLKEVKSFILSDGDVIIGRRGEMGRAAVYSDIFGVMLCGTGSIILKKSPNLSSQFLAYYLRSPFCVDFLTTNAVGSTMVNLNQKIIKSLPFPKLGKKEQETIVKKIEELLSKADAIESQYLLLKEKIDKLPQALLAKAFRGELVPQDPADEPAAVLLEQIQNEIGKLSKKGKKQMELVFED